MSEANKLFYNLEPYVDIAELEACHLEICAGIARSETNMASRVIPHFEMKGDLKALIEFKKSEGARVAEIFEEGARHLSFGEKKVFAKLNHEQKKRFLQLYKGAYWDGEYVRLRFPKREFWNRHDSIFYADMCDWHSNAQYFPKLKSFIEKLPFNEIGRVIFFVTYHYLASDVHYDRENGVYNGERHYLWLNPFQQKKFFLLDDEGNKTYINHKAAVFDGMKLHGADPAPQMCYTIRVDGQLKREVCEKVGLPWVERPLTGENFE